MPRKKSTPKKGRPGRKVGSRPGSERKVRRVEAAESTVPVIIKSEAIQWLAGLDEEDIRAVLMVVGRDPEVKELDMHGSAEELVIQLEGDFPRLESLVIAIEDALGIEREALTRQIRGEFEVEPDIVLDELETELDEEELGFTEDDEEI